jgi:hypothetical protein
MSSRLSSERIQQLTPLLASLARLVAGGAPLAEAELQTLLLGADLESDLAMLTELKRWVLLLKALRAQPSPELRLATMEALVLRGLPEASALLAVDTVASSGARPTTSPNLASAPRIWASVSSLDFGTLAPGQPARGEFEVQGGPGQIVVESDQVTIKPQQFGAGSTRVYVEARPLSEGLLWTTLKLVTASETLQVPVLAQWGKQSAIPSYAPGPTAHLAQPDEELVQMINQALDALPAPQPDTNQANSARNNHHSPVKSGDAELLEQLRRLLG